MFKAFLGAAVEVASAVADALDDDSKSKPKASPRKPAESKGAGSSTDAVQPTKPTATKPDKTRPARVKASGPSLPQQLRRLPAEKLAEVTEALRILEANGLSDVASTQTLRERIDAWSESRNKTTESQELTTVEVAGSGEGGIGLDLESEKGMFRISSVKDKGAIAKWNEQNPEKAISAGLFMKEINGQSVESLRLEEVQKLCEEDQLAIVFAKVTAVDNQDPDDEEDDDEVVETAVQHTWTIDLSKTEVNTLGCEFETTTLLKVKTIDAGGLVADWNEHHPSTPIPQGCYIVAVNGKNVSSVTTRDELKAMLEPEQLSITFQDAVPRDAEHLAGVSYRPEVLAKNQLNGKLPVFNTSPAEIPKTEERGITLSQLQDVYFAIHKNCGEWLETFPGSPNHGKALVDVKVSLYHTDTYWIRPSTKQFQCSYVDLVAPGPQVPKWFVSHWWGEPVFDFVRCLERHAFLRKLPLSTPYWVCAYANNQWKLGGEIQKDPSQTSFRKAMELAVGTVSVVDSSAVTFSRIWCSYEVATTLEGAGTKLYDISTVPPTGERAVVLTDGLTPVDEEQGEMKEWKHRGGGYGYKLNREKAFPMTVFNKAFGVQLEKGQASQEQDRVRILNSIAGLDLDAKPVEDHANYTNVNNTLRWRFGMGVINLASELGLMQDFKLLELPEPHWSRVGKGEACRRVYDEMYKTFRALAKRDLALSMQQRALAIEMETLGEESKEVATSQARIGNIYNFLGKTELAIEYHEKALATRQKLLGEDDPDLAYSYTSMGNIRLNQDKYTEAMDFYKKALAIHIKAVGQEHADVAKCYNDMANIYYYQDKEDMALTSHKQALDMRVKLLGEDHPDVAQSYADMALVYRSKKQYKTSTQYLEKALEIRTQAQGKEHPDVASTYYQLGRTSYFADKPGTALGYYRQALTIRLKIFGHDHKNVAAIYASMGNAYVDKKDWKNAQQNFDAGLDIYIRTLGDKHKLVGDTYRSMGRCWVQQTSPFGSNAPKKKASSYYGKAAKVYEECLGPNHADTKKMKEDAKFWNK
mmetsp:Transcript_43842/g.101285  ORF Transcript_43842/g.101285 Transcript_43842/m.101285 type:complete len:1039 (-) Transcript_43842:212-3328(-)